MNKKKSTFTLLMIGIIIGCSSILPLKSQPLLSPESQDINPQNRELLEKITEDLFRMSRDKKTGGGRGEICAISPQSWGNDEQQQPTFATVQIVSPQPLFLWKTTESDITEIQVLEDSETQQTPIWKADITGGKNHIIYQGEPLEIGTVYYWRLLDEGVKRQTYFQVIPEQDEIQQALKQQEQQLQSEAASAEEIALKKASYLAEKGFWSDVSCYAV